MFRKNVTYRYLCLVLTFFLLTLSGCGEQEQSPAIATATPIKELSGTLRIYYFAPTEGVDSYSPVISKFKSLYPNVVVEADAFNDTAKLESKIAEDKLSGENADLLLLTSDANTIDVHKMAAAGEFMDLGPMLAQDSTYKQKAYYNILSAGMVGGKQLVLPLGFNVTVAHASEEMMKRRELSLPDGMPLSDMMQNISQSMQTYDGGENGTFFLRTTETPLILMLHLANVQPIDWNTKEIAVDEEAMKDIADFSHTVNDSIKEFWAINGQTKVDLLDMLSRVSLIVAHSQIYTVARTYATTYDHYLKEQYHLVTFPTYQNANQYCALVTHYGAISTKCQNPQAAYSLLRLVMDTATEFNADSPLPMQRQNAQSIITSFSKQTGLSVSYKGESTTVQPLTKELATRINTILDSVSCGVIPNAEVDNIINDSMQPYIDGAQPFDECANQLEQRLNTYMNEDSGNASQ